MITVALMLMSIVNVSHATTLSFTNIENNTVDISDQLSVVVADTTDGVTFTFFNNVGITSSVTDIYFDEGEADLYSGFEIIGSSAGAIFEPTAITDSAATPGNLPGGNAVSFSADYSADIAGNPENGLDTSSDYVTFLALAGADFTSYDDLVTALLSGTARIGLHVQAFADGSSDSYVSTVPVPAAGILFATALFGIGLVGRRKKKTSTNLMVGAFTRAS